MKSKIVAWCCLWCSLCLSAQLQEAVTWQVQLVEENQSWSVVLTATIQDGWHLYDINLPDGGPLSTQLHWEQLDGCQADGPLQALSSPTTFYDPIFDMSLRHYEHTASFRQALTVSHEPFSAKGYVEFMACNDASCLPPTTFEFQIGTPLETLTPPPSDTILQWELLTNHPEWWTPQIEALRQFDQHESPTDNSLWRLFLYGFLGGLLALVTPCVWPILPMTVSFFLKRTRSRRKAIGDAVLYGVSIVIIYLVMGLAITLIFGASALNNLATNAVFNLLFFGLLVFFALSFFGFFEIVLPASWANRMDAKADSSSGWISLFFMAFTLVLVSFSCTGPIIGTLLVEAASQGSLGGPAMGMFGFALALALPFSLFAVFPNLMQQMPHSGSWLNTVKVVLGFLELAFSLKFFSVADMAYGWHILPREVFLVLWIVLFICLGCYLLGKIRFPHDAPIKKINPLRWGLALASFAFAVYMIPGLFGASTKAVSAFAPPMSTQRIKWLHDEIEADFHDYESALLHAQSVQKPILLDFSGYGCVNCRKMEHAVWQDERVKKRLREDYVLVTLMVDDKTPLEQPILVSEFGQVRKLRTTGDKWSFLQRHRFGANAQPFYVILSPSGQVQSGAYVFNSDPDDFLEFLK